jgi:NTE family protein
MNNQEKQSLSKKRIGLALSGGGYRAASFHLGTLRKLNSLGILDKVDILSTISGGSIIGAYYVLCKNNFNKFDHDFSLLLKKSVIKKVLLSSTFIRIVAVVLLVLILFIYFQFFTSFPWISIILLITGLYFVIKYQFTIFPVSRIIEEIYDAIFYQKSTLNQFKDKPVIAINSTNLDTGRLFTFSKNRMGDSKYTNEETQFDSNDFPIARSVMASTCVPFAFTPVSVGKHYFTKSAAGSYMKPLLVDGGVYDNQGIHKITHPSNPPKYINDYECDIIITSDAGNKMSFGSAYNNVLTLLSRTSDLFMNRIKMLQIMQNLYQNATGAKKEIAYISLGWDMDKCIPGFVQNLREGKIIDIVKAAHGLTDEFIANHDDEAIKIHLEHRVGYQLILQQNISEEDLKTARSVSTNLTALSDKQISVLSKHAELQTELQVKLYCPSLFNLTN